MTAGTLVGGKSGHSEPGDYRLTLCHRQEQVSVSIKVPVQRSEQVAEEGTLCMMFVHLQGQLAHSNAIVTELDPPRETVQFCWDLLFYKLVKNLHSA